MSASVSGFSESVPLPVMLARVGPACEATVEVPYSLQMRAESKADLPRAPEATVIGSPIAPALTGEAIGTTPGALEDMFRAMQSQPGVAASQDNRNDLLVRGGGAIENQTRIDGFDVPNPNHFGAQGGTGGALSILPPWLIQRGSLELGGFSVAYGDRMSSVADVSLRPGRTDRVHAMFGGGVGGAMAIGEGRMGASGSWLASARRSLLEMAFRDETAEAVPTYADALLKIDHRAGERHAFTFLGLGAKDNVSIVDERTGAEETSGEEVVALAGLRFDSAWSARTSSTVAASIGSSEVDVTAMDGTVVDAIDKGHDQELRVRADVRRTGTPVGDVLVGAAVKAYRYDYDLYVNDLWTPYETVKRDLQARDIRSFTDAAAYAEVAHGLPVHGRLLVGIRIDHWGAASTTAASPRVKAELAPARYLRLVGYWGIYRQGVPYIWQASAPENAGLAPIVSRQFGGGFDIEPKRWLRIGVEAFDKRYDNYPVDPAIPSRVLVSSSADFDSPFVGPLVSEGQVHAYGVDTVAALSAGSARAGDGQLLLLARVAAGVGRSVAAGRARTAPPGARRAHVPAGRRLEHRVPLALHQRAALHTLRRQGLNQGRPGRLRPRADQHAQLPRLPPHRRARGQDLRRRPHGDDAVRRAGQRVRPRERARLQLEPHASRTEGGVSVGAHGHCGSEGGILEARQKPEAEARSQKKGLSRRDAETPELAFLLASDNGQWALLASCF